MSPRLTPLFFLICLMAMPVFADRAPNVVVILADDQGWGDLSLHGNKDVATPHIDSIARDGAAFDRFYVCPVCSPTRAEFFTGRYHVRSNVTGTSTGDERLDLDERLIFQSFRAAGYTTGAFGKWHNGMQAPYHPNSRGIDEYYGFCSGHWGHYFNPLLEHNGRFVRGSGYITDDLTDHAIKFIEQSRDQPFFCYLPYNVPHSPMQVPDDYWNRFKDKPLTRQGREAGREDTVHTRAALAMMENLDWNVGRVLAKLDELKLADNTIVIYFSDNGPNGHRWNGDMKGIKGSIDEGGIRSPLLVRWPGKIPKGTTIKEISAAIDLLPTLADLAGVPLDKHKPLDGMSVKPLLLGVKPQWPDRLIHTHWARKASIRSQRFRMDNEGKLYDMVTDPGQRVDVTTRFPDEAKRLGDAMTQWRQTIKQELSESARPFTVGYSRQTHLPARDGTPHGNIKRSGRAPNCSYFTSWTSTDDRITWDVQVGEAGRYRVDVQYTCPAADLGSVVQLSCQASKTQTKVAIAHDPPAYGSEADRTKNRGSESYVKDFATMSLGTLDLQAGTGQIVLQASSIPGRQAMEVRYLILTREE